MHAPNPRRRRRLSNVSEDPLFLAVSSDVWGREGREGGQGRVRGRSRRRVGRFFRGIFSHAAECKRRSRNVNLTTLLRWVGARGREVGSICLRALNALLEAAEPREYICTRPYCGCRKNSPSKADGARLTNSSRYTYGYSPGGR